MQEEQKSYLFQRLMASRWISDQHGAGNVLGALGSGTHEEERGEENAQIAAENSCISRTGGRLAPSYHDKDMQVLGCSHYATGCRLRSACCRKLYACRLCHDADADHTMDRYATTEMVCMSCGNNQPVARSCRTCAADMASYFCSVCKFFDGGDRPIYHCPFCNVCRVGRGLGIDTFHCMKCNACMHTSLAGGHKCLDRGLESDCPVCSEFMFTSNVPVRRLRCGHYMHSHCFKTYTQRKYRCPICSKSMGNMKAYFSMLDTLIANEAPLPQSLRDRKTKVTCMDCYTRSDVPFHFVYHKCPNCSSYNTRQIG